MSQDSQHGKWTISSSDDDDEEEDLPLSGTTTTQSRLPAESGVRSPSPVQVSAPVEVKVEPARLSAAAPLTLGSEGRRSAAKNQLNPVKCERSPSLAGKRKSDASEGTGWALSDSDDDDKDVKENSQSHLPKKAPPSPKTKKPKVKEERPPSPHGRLYYIDEPEDFFESNIPCLNDTYRFYLNKVTGLDKKYNTGALHIRGEFAFV